MDISKVLHDNNEDRSGFDNLIESIFLEEK